MIQTDLQYSSVSSLSKGLQTNPGAPRRRRISQIEFT